MQPFAMLFSPRFIILTLCIFVTALLVCGAIYDFEDIFLFAIPIVIFGSLSVLGIHDLLQKNHAVLRNYPISAHIRFLLEEIRPEMWQYFFARWFTSALRWCSTSARSVRRKMSTPKAMSG